MANNEKLPYRGEQEFNQAELEATRAEKAAELERSFEAAGERGKESLETARAEALEATAQAEKEQPHKAAHETTRLEQAPKLRPTKRDKQNAYDKTMHEVRSELSAPSKAFSSVIHNDVIEKASDVIGSTVARPNLIIAGSISAFIVTLGLYLVTKHYGYPLSGFETIGSFIAGWSIGAVIEYVRVGLLGRR